MKSNKYSKASTNVFTSVSNKFFNKFNKRGSCQAGEIMIINRFQRNVINACELIKGKKAEFINDTSIDT